MSLKQVILWYFIIQAVQDDRVLAGCKLEPKDPDVYLDEWFTLTFIVDCDIDIREVHLYTAGNGAPITRNTTFKPYLNIGERTECMNGKQNYSISINLTDEVHQYLNQVVTARGINPGNPSNSCTSLPSARYDLKQNPINAPGAGSTNITATIISMTASPSICQPIVSEMNGSTALRYSLITTLLSTLSFGALATF